MMREKRATLILLLILCFPIVALPNTEIASATEDSWTTMEPMPTARAWLGVAVVDGKIFAIYSGINYDYDPSTNSWTTKTPMPTPRSSFGIAVVENKIYVIGGSTGDYNYTNVNEVYDPSTDTWETKTSMPTIRHALDANVVNGKIYLIGGGQRTPNDDSSMYTYVDDDNVSRSFTTIFNMLRNYNPDGVRDHIWDIYDLFMGFFEEDHWTLEHVFDVYTLHGIEIPGIPSAPTITVSPYNQYMDIGTSSSVSYSITVTNTASISDTYELEVLPRFSRANAHLPRVFTTDSQYDLVYENELTIGPNQGTTTTLTVNRLNPLDQPCLLGTDTFRVKVTSKTTGFDESATCILQVDYQPTYLSIPEGGLAVDINPKRIHLSEEPTYFEVTLFNNQNFDDVICAKVDVDGILSEYQALSYWIRDEVDYQDYYAMVWNEERIYIPAKDSFTLPLSVNTNLYLLLWGTTKTLWATWNPQNGNEFRVFRITATSQKNPSVTAQDSGILTKDVSS
ncbi:MAG: hypothetical protein JSW14_00495 [Candidatus Bathyarchaeum sp.]|nr:MAG: hypothetical protein JSW14_00495 [Candidatus Bathyarchaeum sp.]